jgi:hypothetical protein
MELLPLRTVLRRNDMKCAKLLVRPWYLHSRPRLEKSTMTKMVTQARTASLDHGVLVSNGGRGYVP